MPIKTAKEFDNNRVVDELQYYCTLSDAAQDFPDIDNIVVGVCNLDLGGNTRPLSTRILYTLLSQQRIISTAAIMDAQGYSRSHTQKVCACLRIASREIVKHLDKFPNKYVYNGGMWPQKV